MATEERVWLKPKLVMSIFCARVIDKTDVFRTL